MVQDTVKDCRVKLIIGQMGDLLQFLAMESDIARARKVNPNLGIWATCFAKGTASKAVLPTEIRTIVGKSPCFAYSHTSRPKFEVSTK